jgi:hypothetical protein
MPKSEHHPAVPERPPYKCGRTPDAEWCLKFNWNEATQRYDSPSEGVRVRCSACEYFFDS